MEFILPELVRSSVARVLPRRIPRPRVAETAAFVTGGLKYSEQNRYISSFKCMTFMKKGAKISIVYNAVCFGY
jgi:hypothetical protein